MGQPVTQWQILSRNPDAQAAFYSAVFGWTVDAANPLGYRRISTESSRGISGGLWPAPPEGHAFVQLFIEVDDAAAHLDKATSLGAKVVIPLTALPEGGRLAILMDPEGVTFGLHQPS